MSGTGTACDRVRPRTAQSSLRARASFSRRACTRSVRVCTAPARVARVVFHRANRIAARPPVRAKEIGVCAARGYGGCLYETVFRPVVCCVARPEEDRYDSRDDDRRGRGARRRGRRDDDASDAERRRVVRRYLLFAFAAVPFLQTRAVSVTSSFRTARVRRNA